MLTVLIFIIVIGVLVLVHELGHFVMAKRAGMKVEEFGFGFPPRIFGIKKGETMYSINWIPFGGFVKIFGENGEGTDNSRSFSSKSAAIRSKVILAGVVMNVLFAFVLLGFGNLAGLRVGVTDDAVSAGATDLKIQIVQIAPGSPAQEAGFGLLDSILGFKDGGETANFENMKEVQEFIAKNAGTEITLVLQRGSQTIESNLTPRKNPPPGEGAIGVSLATTGIIKYPWYQAFYQGTIQTAILTGATAVGYATIIKNLILGSGPGVDLTGPIGIAQFTGRAAEVGFAYLLQFTALISINLAILNIIPFPALDGGRLLFILIEKLKRKPVSQKVENLVNAAGFALLILLMIYVTAKDVIRFL